MKVTLNIENDAELRAYIKECIKGQAMAIVRDELTDVIRNEITRKLKGSDSYHFNNLLQSAVSSVVREILVKEHNVDRWNTDFIKPYADMLVSQAISGKDWKKMVDDLAKEKVRSLIS